MVAWQRGSYFQKCGARFLSDSQIGQWRGDVEHKQRLHLGVRQAGQGSAVVIHKSKAPLSTWLAIDWDAGHAEGLDIAIDRPLGDFELFGQLVCGEFAVESAGASGVIGAGRHAWRGFSVGLNYPDKRCQDMYDSIDLTIRRTARPFGSNTRRV